jgi:peptidoglycan/LPS O-acetylase OafA/YrhL
VEAAGTLALLPKLNALRTGRGLLYRAITFISIISYSLYLLNFSVIAFHLMPCIYRAFGLAGAGTLPVVLVRFTLFWMLSIGLSWLLYRFYERPMMELRGKFARRR